MRQSSARSHDHSGLDETPNSDDDKPQSDDVLSMRVLDVVTGTSTNNQADEPPHGMAKRSPRHRSEFNDPSKPAWYEANRNDAHYQTRLDPTLAARVDEFRAASGLTKREITETALRRYLAQELCPKG